jgi:hypothetical protein
MNDPTTPVPKLRPDLPPLPDRISQLPIGDNGYPVPWFVATMPATGKPDHRVVNPAKVDDAVSKGLCFVCGHPLGRFCSFVVGPMCTVNRITSEPPCHKECAIFSAIACPFLTKPQMTRRDEENGPPGTVPAPGIMIKRNPGCVAVWTYEGRYLARLTNRGFLFNLPTPTEVLWFAEGKPATRKQILAAVNSGLALIEPKKAFENVGDRITFLRLLKAAREHFPKE